MLLHSSFISCCRKTSPQHDTVTTMLHCNNDIDQTMGTSWVSPDMMIDIQAKELKLCFSRPENLVLHGLRTLLVPLGKLQAGCDVPHTKEWFPSGHSVIQA